MDLTPVEMFAAREFNCPAPIVPLPASRRAAEQGTRRLPNKTIVKQKPGLLIGRKFLVDDLGKANAIRIRKKTGLFQIIDFPGAFCELSGAIISVAYVTLSVCLFRPLSVFVPTRFHPRRRRTNSNDDAERRGAENRDSFGRPSRRTVVLLRNGRVAFPSARFAIASADLSVFSRRPVRLFNPLSRDSAEPGLWRNSRPLRA